jgi:hypothetical protein
MVPSRDRNLHFLDDEAEKQIADDFQATLQRFRLEHYHDVRIATHPDLSRMSPRMQDVFRVLAAPMLGDAELVARLLPCLKTQDEEARLDRLGEPEWVVLDALLWHSHDVDPKLFVGNLGATANNLLQETGENYKLTDEAVGRIARRQLGVSTKRVGRGYYINLSTSVRGQIHRLARSMGLARADMLYSLTVQAGYAGPPCRLCDEFGLNILPDGTELRSVSLPKTQRRGSLFD